MNEGYVNDNRYYHRVGPALPWKRMVQPTNDYSPGSIAWRGDISTTEENNKQQNDRNLFYHK